MKLFSIESFKMHYAVAVVLLAGSTAITGCSDSKGNQKDIEVMGFMTNMNKITNENEDFRRVLYTTMQCQLVVTSLKPNEDIGEETHKNIEQFFRVESGSGKCIINGHVYELKPGDAMVIPAGSSHNIINTSNSHLKIHTVYSPPRHRDGTRQETKEDALVSNEKLKFNGVASENKLF